MSGLINNVHDHARSEIGSIVFAQYYPDLKKNWICIADSGVGIPENVRQYLNQAELSSRETVEWALQRTHTTK